MFVTLFTTSSPDGVRRVHRVGFYFGDAGYPADDHHLLVRDTQSQNSLLEVEVAMLTSEVLKWV